jgi:transposase
MSPHFALLDARSGRPAIPSETARPAELIQGRYTSRSEGLRGEQSDYKVVFRWFVGLTMDDAVWDATEFTRKRGGLRGEAARAFLEHVGAGARAQHLLSSEHFAVDGILIEA